MEWGVGGGAKVVNLGNRKMKPAIEVESVYNILLQVSVRRDHMAYFCVHSFANLLYFGLSVL